MRKCSNIEDMLLPASLKLKHLSLLLLPFVWGCSGDVEAEADKNSASRPESIMKGSATEDSPAQGNDISESNSVESSATSELRSLSDAADSEDADQLKSSEEAEADIDDSQMTASDPAASVTVRAMSLNVYGYKTMPQSAGDYADLIEENNIDIVGLQEGVNDWLIATSMPTDYSRSNALAAALGECWQQRYQLFINICSGFTFVSSDRFDLTDGPNATRTGEVAVVEKQGRAFAFIDIHWDHESSATKLANARETAAIVNDHSEKPVIVLGDFNTSCSGSEANSMADLAGLKLIVNGGIDCIFSRDALGAGSTVNASPSDHPAVIAELTL